MTTKSINAPAQPQTAQEIQARIDMLSEEIDANEEETRAMYEEIQTLYRKLDALSEAQ